MVGAPGSILNFAALFLKANGSDYSTVVFQYWMGTQRWHSQGLGLCCSTSTGQHLALSRCLPGVLVRATQVLTTVLSGGRQNPTRTCCHTNLYYLPNRMVECSWRSQTNCRPREIHVCEAFFYPNLVSSPPQPVSSVNSNDLAANKHLRLSPRI